MGGFVPLDRLQPRFARVAPSKLTAARLASLLSAPDATFYGEDEDDNYLRSATLVATLMVSAEGRAHLGQVLQAQARQPCTEVDAVALLMRSFECGWTQLAIAWCAMHRERSTVPHAF